MNETKNGKLIESIYKNVRMGYDSLNTLIPKVNDEHLKTDLDLQKKDYNSFMTRTENFSTDYQVPLKPENTMVKKSAEIGINMHTMFDSSSSKIAEMVIQGSTMGIVEMTRELNNSKDCDGRLKQLGNDVLSFERNNVERLKNYL